tara:strand:+ start:721 stop:2046 length:1326 start_codon:yes stop_codon:yes gene_type:complete
MIEIALKNLKEKKYLAALDILKKLNHSKPNNPDILYCLGNVYYELNDLNKSIFYFEKSYRNFPNSEVIINNYAMVLQNLGKIEEATNLFKKLINKNPKNIKAYFGLFITNPKNIYENYLDKLKTLTNDNNITLEDKSLINYIFSRNEKNNNNIDGEIKLLNKAHHDYFKHRNKYNLNLLFYLNEVIYKNYDKINVVKKSLSSFYSNTIKPIFIIGLPRSGSTLIENLISQNNENIYSYGESGIIDSCIFDQLKNSIFNENFNSKNLNLTIDYDVLINSLKNVYSFSEEKRFVDKSLENFFYIDLILQLFPEAKFIHTFRNKFDSAIAIHQSMLINLPWSHNTKHISEHILNYEKIMNYFKKKYSDKILDLELENLTSNPEIYSKKIYDFCDLTWNKSFLDFYKNDKLFSKTNSSMQIRDKIKKYDKNKYQPYYFLIENLLN